MRWLAERILSALRPVPSVNAYPAELGIFENPRNQWLYRHANENPTKVGHGYLDHYGLLFFGLRQDPNIVEIGVETGASLRMWASAFPDGRILGVDIDPACSAHRADRIGIIIGDQTDMHVCSKIRRYFPGGADIIVDDGGHKPWQQSATFNELWPMLNDGGFYCIEDVGGCVGDPSLTMCKWAYRHLVKRLFFWPIGYSGRDWKKVTHTSGLASQIRSVMFFRNLIVIQKGRNPPA